MTAATTPETGTEAVVALAGVDKWFGSLHVLQGIDLTVRRGEVVVVIGPSGSGKSTLCRAINRLVSLVRSSGQAGSGDPPSASMTAGQVRPGLLPPTALSCFRWR